MEHEPKALVTREEFDRFCQSGRLAGSWGNANAGSTLKQHLEQEGFTAYEGPRLKFSFRRVALGLSVWLALALWQRDWFVVFPAVVVAGGMGRVWRGVRAGAPAAVYGVPKSALSTCVGDAPKPTLILCAHYDSAAAPLFLHGSFLRAAVIMLAFLTGADLLARFVHPLAGFGAILAILTAFTFAMWGSNASPGADDNASGVFAVLACARQLVHHSHVNIVPVFFNFEEQGLIGSRAWVRSHLGKRGQGLPGLTLDRRRVYVINFDCVGRGRRVFVAGNRRLRARLLSTATARAVGARRTWFYPSDHLAFRPRWPAVSFVRSDRFWLLDLGWVHSRHDSPREIDLEKIAELVQIVNEFVEELSTSQP